MSKIDQPHPPENLAFASELIKARNELGFTQSQLSGLSNVSLSAIKGYETGRNMPGARELRELCRVLRVTPNKLLFGVESPFPTLNSDDPAAVPGEKGLAVQRGRIAFLAHLLSFDESYAVYSLIYSIAIGRFGETTVRGTLESADLMTGFKLLTEGKGMEIDLLPKDKEFLKSLKEALESAAHKGQTTEIPLEFGEFGLKVSKK